MSIRRPSNSALILATLIATGDARPVSPSETELLKNPTFSSDAEGWMLRDASVVPDPSGKSRQVLLQGVKPSPNSFSFAGVNIESVPTDHKLRFSCSLCGTTSGQKVWINAFAYNPSCDLVMQWPKQVVLEKNSWKQFDTTYVVPKEGTRLSIWIVDQTVQSAYLSKPSLLLGEYQKAQPVKVVYSTAADATNVIEAHYKACVKTVPPAKTGVITFPIPGFYREQIPLTFDVSTEPPNALVRYQIHRRQGTQNWICEVTLKPPVRGTIINWDSLVIVSGRAASRLPKVKASVPKEVRQWTRSTACVQSADDAIRAKANQLAIGADDTESYVRQVIAFTAANKGTGKTFVSLDAASALGCGGSCTSRANLAAALLRAHGIAARTVSHLPAWFDSPLFEHWLVEYWHPGVGWVWIEPTLERFQPPPNELVILAESSPDDENKAGNPIHLRYIMPGAAYLSGCELSKELVQANLLPNANGPNTVHVTGRVRGTDSEMRALLESAHGSWIHIAEQSVTNEQSLARTQLIRTAIQHGSASELLAAMNNEKE